jgi:hypothetical protein
MGRHRTDWRAPIRDHQRRTGESFWESWAAIRGRRPGSREPKILVELFQGPRQVVYLGPGEFKRSVRGHCMAQGRFRERKPGRLAYEYTQSCLLFPNHAGDHWNGDDRDPLRWSSGGGGA